MIYSYDRSSKTVYRIYTEKNDKGVNRFSYYDIFNRNIFYQGSG